MDNISGDQALHLLVQNSREAYSPVKVYYLVQYFDGILMIGLLGLLEHLGLLGLLEHYPCVHCVHHSQYAQQQYLLFLNDIWINMSKGIKLYLFFVFNTQIKFNDKIEKALPFYIQFNNFTYLFSNVFILSGQNLMSISRIVWDIPVYNYR